MLNTHDRTNDENDRLLTGSSQHNEKVHAVDTNARIVSDAQIDVLLNAEAKIARGREVGLFQLVFLYLETFFQNLLGLFATHRTVDGDFFVSSDTKRSNRVSSCVKQTQKTHISIIFTLKSIKKKT